MTWRLAMEALHLEWLPCRGRISNAMQMCSVAAVAGTSLKEGRA